MHPNEFRKIAHQLVDWIADYRASVETRPVMANVKPGDIRNGFSATPPAEAHSLASLTSDLDERILPGITHWNHPSFFAYFPANASLSSVLADMIATGLGVQGMSWQTSPAATELEEVVMDWLRQMVGLPETFTGVIHDTASTATLVALLCARERTTKFSGTDRGLQAEPQPLTVYCSDQAHSSVEKAAVLAGFGRSNLRLIASDDQHAMRADALEEAVTRDVAAGRVPCAVIASIGTTATTAVDPLRDVAAIARSRGLWLHVDAALAGSAMVAPEFRALWAGVDLADSLVFNPHKWLGVAFDCTAYFVRDTSLLRRVMGTDPSYLKTAEDEAVRNFRDWGIPLGRRFRALKLWLLIRESGIEGLRARVRRDVENARWLARQVEVAADWTVTAPVHLQTVCVRHAPAHMTVDALNEHSQKWCERINRSGAAYLTSTIVKGTRIVRVSVGAEATERRHVEALWECMQNAVREENA